MAERVGFEPTVAGKGHTGFQDRAPETVTPALDKTYGGRPPALTTGLRNPCESPECNTRLGLVSGGVSFPAILSYC